MLTPSGILIDYRLFDNKKKHHHGSFDICITISEIFMDYNQWRMYKEKRVFSMYPCIKARIFPQF